MNTENEILVKDIRNNNKEALDALMLKLKRMIKYFEKNNKLDNADILDLIYQILINENLKIDNLKNYLFSCLNNEICTRYKNNLKEEETIKDLIVINNMSDSIDKKIEENRTFEEIIKNLNKKDQKYLTLKYKYGYSFREIAAIERIPKSTIEYQIKRACKELRDILSK